MGYWPLVTIVIRANMFQYCNVVSTIVPERPYTDRLIVAESLERAYSLSEMFSLS